VLRLIFILNLWIGAANASAGVSGQLKSITDYYPQTLYEPVDDLIPTLHGQLSGKAKWSKSLRVQWKLLASSNLVAEGDAKTYPARTESFYGDIQEAYIEKKFGQQKISLGYNTVNWGVMDLYSPMDAVNTSVLFHPVRSQRQGAGMLQWGFSGDWLEADALYIPWQTPPLLPDMDSRWLPRKFLVNVSSANGKIYLPDQLEYQQLRPEALRQALQHNGGLRLAAHIGRVDISAMHYEGAATTAKVRPTISVTTVGGAYTARSPIQIAPLYARMRTSGLGLVWATDQWIFKNENVYQAAVTKDPLVQNWSIQNVIGAETNWNIFDGTLTTIFQFYYAHNPESSDNTMGNYFRLFDRTPVTAFRYAVSDDLTILSSVLYESKAQGFFFIAGFEQKLKDALSWGLSWRDFSARNDGILKTYDRNDHGSMELTYFF
jgi:hypothetical protein